MNSDPLSLFNCVPEANVFATVTSLLLIGKPDILEAHIFNRERMGILVSFCVQVLVLHQWWLIRAGSPGSHRYLCRLLNFRPWLAIAVRMI